jgi:hypothetical protein
MTVAELIAELRRLPPSQTMRWLHYGVEGVIATDLITELEAADPATTLHGEIELGPSPPPPAQDPIDWRQFAHIDEHDVWVVDQPHGVLDPNRLDDGVGLGD